MGISFATIFLLSRYALFIRVIFQYIVPRVFIYRVQDMPAKYIYEPWTAPTAVQQQAGCIIGKDYPAPIVDHAAVLKVNLEKMKAAYAAGKIAAGDVDSSVEQPAKKKSKK